MEKCFQDPGGKQFPPYDHAKIQTERKRKRNFQIPRTSKNPSPLYHSHRKAPQDMFHPQREPGQTMTGDTENRPPGAARGIPRMKGEKTSRGPSVEDHQSTGRSEGSQEEFSRKVTWIACPSALLELPQGRFQQLCECWLNKL